MTDSSPPAGPPSAGPSIPTGPLRIGAYLLMGDPAFLEQCVRSLYAIAERIVVVYDKDGVGWTGRPLPVEQCLAVVERLDGEKKVELLAGTYHGRDVHPLEAETDERNDGIRAFGDDVDWVVQLDTDEVLGDPARFVRAIGRAHAEGRSALEYPARWLYAHVNGELYLERCRRFWGISAGFPGAMAVRAGTTLRLARQCDAPLWRIDFRRRNTDPAHPRTARVDEVIRGNEGIWHFSWVRSEEQMRSKSTTSGHVDDLNWNREIDRWIRRSRHPYLATAITPVRRPPALVGAPTWLRTARVPASATAGD